MLNQDPLAPRPSRPQNPLGGPDAVRWAQQVAAGDFREIRQFLAQTRASQDWQDRACMVSLAAEDLTEDVINAACAAEPDAVDLKLLRAYVLSNMIGKSRGSKRADDTTDEQFQGAAYYVEATLACVGELVAADPGDPLPHVQALRSFMVFTQHHDYVKKAYEAAIQAAPNFVGAHMSMVNAQSEKWCGSHAESLQVARSAMSRSRLGDDTPSCLFMAHLLIYEYIRGFQKNAEGAQAYLKNPQVVAELNTAFDQWAGMTQQVRRCSVAYWHYPAAWYYYSRDRNRLRRALAFTNNTYSSWPWNMGNAEKIYANALQYAETGELPGKKAVAPAPPPKKGLLDWFKR